MKFNLCTENLITKVHAELIPGEVYANVRVANYVRYKRRGKPAIGRFYKHVKNIHVENAEAFDMAMTYMGVTKVRFHRDGKDCTAEVHSQSNKMIKSMFGGS